MSYLLSIWCLSHLWMLTSHCSLKKTPIQIMIKVQLVLFNTGNIIQHLKNQHSILSIISQFTNNLFHLYTLYIIDILSYYFIPHKYILALWTVNCSVIKFNLFQVNQKLGVSPGNFTSKLALLRDLQHKKRKAIAVTRAAKQRRIRLKLERYF